MTFRPRFRTLIILTAVLAGLHLPAAAQVSLDFERGRMRAVLATVAGDVERNFYDPELKGLDWKALRAQAEQRIAQAESLGEMMGAIFTMIDQLKDSHTAFLPPGRSHTAQFGFEAKPFGDAVRVFKVEKGGAAEAAGLEVGDRLLLLNRFRVERESFDRLMFILRVLRGDDRMEVVFQRREEAPRTVRLEAKIRQRPFVQDFNIFDLIREIERELTQSEARSYPEGVGYLTMPHFLDDPGRLQRLLGRMRDSKAVIIDLRDNGGGALHVFRELVGHFEPEPVVVARLERRRGTETLRSPRKRPVLQQPMVVLVDSRSMSAAEMFARYFQRTGRAVVVGDHTFGRVTASRFFPREHGMDVVIFYGVQVAVARVFLAGEEDLEGRGVAPDHHCVPTEADLRQGADPCLDMALKLAAQLTAERRGQAP